MQPRLHHGLYRRMRAQADLLLDRDLMQQPMLSQIDLHLPQRTPYCYQLQESPGLPDGNEQVRCRLLVRGQMGVRRYTARPRVV